MTLAKAITSGYASLGAVITTEEIADSVSKKIEGTPNLYATFLYSTYGWAPFQHKCSHRNPKFSSSRIKPNSSQTLTK